MWPRTAWPRARRALLGISVPGLGNGGRALLAPTAPRRASQGRRDACGVRRVGLSGMRGGRRVTTARRGIHGGPGWTPLGVCPARWGRMLTPLEMRPVPHVLSRPPPLGPRRPRPASADAGWALLRRPTPRPVSQGRPAPVGAARASCSVGSTPRSLLCGQGTTLLLRILFRSGSAFWSSSATTSSRSLDCRTVRWSWLPDSGSAQRGELDWPAAAVPRGIRQAFMNVFNAATRVSTLLGSSFSVSSPSASWFPPTTW
mmetsp:Transcript_140165/g.314838  ORF Transcript_140165/g.314838 Transcript_140165/m.314838 type:complete len:258 (+) Transcript_140165:1015-1788(+)